MKSFITNGFAMLAAFVSFLVIIAGIPFGIVAINATVKDSVSIGNVLTVNYQEQSDGSGATVVETQGGIFKVQGMFPLLKDDSVVFNVTYTNKIKLCYEGVSVCYKIQK